MEHEEASKGPMNERVEARQRYFLDLGFKVWGSEHLGVSHPQKLGISFLGVQGLVYFGGYPISVGRSD